MMPIALCSAGIALAFVVGDLDSGAAYIDRALRAQSEPGGLAWFFSGLVKVWLGEPEVAIEHEARAMRLSPHDPMIFNMQAATACRALLRRSLCRGVVMGGNVNPGATGLHPLDIRGGGQRCARGKRRGRTKGHGRLASTHARVCAFPISRTCIRSGARKISIDGAEALRKAGLPE